MKNARFASLHCRSTQHSAHQYYFLNKEIRKKENCKTVFGMLKSERDFYFYIAKSSLNEKTLI